MSRWLSALVAFLCLAGSPAYAAGGVPMLDSDGAEQGSAKVNLVKGSVKRERDARAAPGGDRHGNGAVRGDDLQGVPGLDDRSRAGDPARRASIRRTLGKVAVKAALKGDVTQLGLDRVVIVAFSKDGLNSFDVLDRHSRRAVAGRRCIAERSRSTLALVLVASVLLRAAAGRRALRALGDRDLPGAPASSERPSTPSSPAWASPAPPRAVARRSRALRRRAERERPRGRAAAPRSTPGRATRRAHHLARRRPSGACRPELHREPRRRSDRRGREPDADRTAGVPARPRHHGRRTWAGLGLANVTVSGTGMTVTAATASP